MVSLHIFPSCQVGINIDYESLVIIIILIGGKKFLLPFFSGHVSSRIEKYQSTQTGYERL